MGSFLDSIFFRWIVNNYHLIDRKDLEPIVRKRMLIALLLLVQLETFVKKVQYFL